MGFLSLIGLGEKPRTAEQIAPTIDLARGIVCDIGREDTRETIKRRLGVPTETRKHGLFYEQIGLHIGVAKTGRVTGWSVMFSPLVPPLTWIASGERRTGEPPPEAKVLALLGTPTKRETDDEELMLTWERAGITILVDYALDGAMNDIFVDFT